MQAFFKETFFFLKEYPQQHPQKDTENPVEEFNLDKLFIFQI